MSGRPRLAKTTARAQGLIVRTRQRAARSSAIVATFLAVMAAGPQAGADVDTGVARLVLIVGNNRPADTRQAPLRFADDDALRYYERFEGLAEHRILLTRLDEESRPYAALYPEIQPPTRSAIARAAGSLRAAAARLRREGRFVEIVFVFAGHGGIEAGRPYLALEDVRIHPEDLESLLLEGDPADVVHVIIDACHAAGFVERRGPMRGARDALGADVLPFGRLVERHPRVGFVVAAAASGNAFEWSRYGGGVASHLIRSALSGAADVAPPDGRVTYDELGAFLRTATAGILPSEFRQQIRVVPPRALPSAAILELDAREGSTELLVDRPGRWFVRDADGHRIVDLNHGRGTARLLLMARSPRFQLVEVRERGSGCSGPVRGRVESCVRQEHSHELVAGGRHRASELAVVQSSLATRGVVEDTVFEELLARPYDAASVTSWATEQARPPRTTTAERLLATRAALGVGYRGSVARTVLGLGALHGFELRLDLAPSPRLRLGPVVSVGRGDASNGLADYPVWQVDAGIAGSWVLYAGPVELAVGAEFRWQGIEQAPPGLEERFGSLLAGGALAQLYWPFARWLDVGLVLSGGGQLSQVDGAARARPYGALHAGTRARF